jgi:hypothetical protein
MTARKNTTLAQRRRESKEQRERVKTATEISNLKVSKDIDPAELLKAAKAIIHTEVQRMAKVQAEGEPLTLNDSKKLSALISTMGALIGISEKTKPDLTGLSDEELARLAGEGG